MALFSRTFRQVFGVSPSAWRSGTSSPGSNQMKTKSNQSQTVSNDGENGTISSMYFCRETKVDGKIGRMEIAAGTYAVCR